MSDFDFLGDDYIPADEADSGGFETVPPGRYGGVVVRAETAETRSGGLMLKVAVKLTGPSHAGAWVWGNLNLKNASQAAQRIGRQQFGALCVAAGFPKRPPSSVELLLDREIEVQVIHDEWNGEKRAKIKSFHAPKMAPPRTAADVHPASTAPSSPGRNPWGA